MIGEADYRNITSSVRTPRLAVFIDQNNPFWRTGIASLVRIFSQTWGGKYFLIVPTDGKRIKDKYWELLEAYSPDYLGTYQVTLADLEEADAAQYSAVAGKWREGWSLDEDFDEWFGRQQYHEVINEFEIDAPLQVELKNRLAPFHHSDRVVQHHQIIRDHGISFPFTDITDINRYANGPVEKLVLPKKVDDLDLRAMMLSLSGDLGQSVIDEFAAQGVAAETLPDNYPSEELVEAVMRGSIDAADFRLNRAVAGQIGDTSWRPSEDFVKHLPFQASMLHLGRYYRTDMHRDYEEPITMVVGDTIDDFCLYYCLSRLHDGVYWLPKKWLDACHRRSSNNLRLRRKGRPPLDYSETARVASTIIREAYRALGFGPTGKQIEVRSFSLSADDLRRTVAVMDSEHWGARGEFAGRTKIAKLSDRSTDCVARVIEQDNYMNQQDMVFIGGKSVSWLATPKPRNFSIIDPSKHRWLTSFEISDYAPPTLPFLGRQIALTHQSRVAIDGVAFLCPGIMTVGTNIDSNLTRPRLVIVGAPDIIRQYFAEAGLEISPSDKGNYLVDTIGRFGGLPTAAQFMASPNTRGILDLFLAKRSADDGHVVFLKEERKAFISHAGVRGCVGDEATSVIDDLIGKDILRRGLIFKCNRCRLASWYDLADLTTEFTCRRCSQRQQFTKANWRSPDEPTWYYALAETVYQCYVHNSHLTVVALERLRARSKVHFEYLPEIDVANFPRKGETHEIDIACLVDNRIVIGECKTEPLRPSHTEKYEALAKALGKRPDEIVFATSHEHVSDEFRTKVSSMAGASILTKAELFG